MSEIPPHSVAIVTSFICGKARPCDICPNKPFEKGNTSTLPRLTTAFHELFPDTSIDGSVFKISGTCAHKLIPLEMTGLV